MKNYISSSFQIDFDNEKKCGECCKWCETERLNRIDVSHVFFNVRIAYEA